MTDLTINDLEIIEAYRLIEEKVYRVRVKGTKIIFNVHADERREALDKALKMAKTIGLSEEIVKIIKSKQT